MECSIRRLLQIFLLVACLLSLYTICFAPHNTYRHIMISSTSNTTTSHNNTTSGQLNTYRPLLTKTLYPLTLSRDYILNNVTICSGVKKVSILFWVHTAFHHFQKRQEMRLTFMNQTKYLPEVIRTIFLVGRNKNDTDQRKIVEEHRKYGDVIQGDFLDSYHNLTHKGVLALRWISENCPHTKYVVKLDDDVLFNTRHFIDTVYKTHRNATRTLLGWISYRGRVFRAGKWKIDADQLKGWHHWPWKYCMGLTVILTGDIIPALYNAAFISPFFWVDDVYLFGILPHKVRHVTYLGLPGLFMSGGSALNCIRVSGCSPIGILLHAGSGMIKLFNCMERETHNSSTTCSI